MLNSLKYLSKRLLYKMTKAGFLLAGLLILLTASHSLISVEKLSDPGHSFKVFEREGLYPSYGLPFRTIVLDNYTDSLMVNIAYASDPTNSLQSAFLNPRYHSPDAPNQIDAFRTLIQKDDGSRVNYERYWHGYLTYLKPLLTIVSYDGIRAILHALLVTGLIAFFIIAWKQHLRKLAIAAATGFVLIDTPYLGQSIQFSGVMIIALAAGITALLAGDRIHPLVLSLVTGGLTSFIDLLTAPLITLGIVLIVDFARYPRSVIRMLAICMAWAIGYLGIWSLKWIMVELFIAPGALRTALETIGTRTGGKADEAFSHFEAVRRNLFQLVGYDRSNKIAAVVVGIGATLFLLRYNKFSAIEMRNLIPLAAGSMIPYLWYLVAANHSYIHVWYTYRSQFLTVAAATLAYLEMLDLRSMNQDYRRLCRVIKRLRTRC
ncbi:MAG: hypothetical protein N2691_00820 [Patescibacteria group bacterium]|nr:hypothetical protein [Patescibacteria group bacterium]